MLVAALLVWERQVHIKMRLLCKASLSILLLMRDNHIVHGLSACFAGMGLPGLMVPSGMANPRLSCNA